MAEGEMVPSMTCGDCPVADALCHQGRTHRSKGTTATPATCLKITWLSKPSDTQPTSQYSLLKRLGK